MPFTNYFGVFSPDELAIMHSVFNRLCEERRLAETDGHQREALAAEIIHVFQRGRTTEAELWQSLTKRRST